MPRPKPVRSAPSNPVATPRPPGTSYAITLKNLSAEAWRLFVYQRATSALYSLAWLATPYLIRSGDEVTFDWHLRYDFVWSDTGVLAPGVAFRASGQQPCSPSGDNYTQFDRLPGPGLSVPIKSSPSGALIIQDNKDVPPSRFAVGIGMSGAGTFVQQAGPNLVHEFRPDPSYWVGAGRETKLGEVLDIETLTPTAEAIFPPGVYALDATLTPENEWEVAPS